MRHLPISHRTFREAGQSVLYKTRCGQHRADRGSYPRGSAHCPRCFTAAYEGSPAHPSELSISSAVEMAKRFADRRGILSQHTYFALAKRLDPTDRAEFGVALSANQIRVRTGSVNVVDEGFSPPPPAEGDQLSGVGLMPSEFNDDPDGSMTDLMKPIHTEGEKKAAPSGWNLEDLTVANAKVVAGMKASPTEVIALLNEGLSIEFSQAARYRFYAETILAPYRESIAEDFLVHAADEDSHARWLMRRIVGLGGEPDFQVDPPEFITGPRAVVAVLEILFEKEQEGIDFYLRLRDALGDDPTVHVVEETLVKELEHLDDLARMAGLFERLGALALPDDASMWADSYDDTNTSEGLQRMGRVAALERWKRRADAVKRKTRVGEIPIHIEWNNGETRKGEGANGPWERVMQADYGFIPDTVGSDNEPIDVYVGGHPQSRDIYVVNQLHPDGSFDEEKVMIAFQSPEEAEAIYRAHYPENGASHFGGMTKYSTDEFLNAFVRPPSDEGYTPKIFMQQVRKDADHGPGDADGCGGGTPSTPTPKEKTPGQVDTSPVKSPAEQLMKSSPGRMKQLHDQVWRLLSGPGMNTWADLSVDDVVRTAASVVAEYDSPDHGSLGEPDKPADQSTLSGA